MFDSLHLDQTLDLANQQIERQRISGGIQQGRTPEEAGKNFESFFITHMLEQMFSGLGTDGLFGGGHAEKVYRSLLTQEYGKSISEQGGIGIADMITAELVKLQEDAEHSASVLAQQQASQTGQAPAQNPVSSAVQGSGVSPQAAAHAAAQYKAAPVAGL